jgi:hypothetical protein
MNSVGNMKVIYATVSIKSLVKEMKSAKAMHASVTSSHWICTPVDINGMLEIVNVVNLPACSCQVSTN